MGEGAGGRPDQRSRIETYAIESPWFRGDQINGAAAHLIHPGDKVIIMYESLGEERSTATNQLSYTWTRKTERPIRIRIHLPNPLLETFQDGLPEGKEIKLDLHADGQVAPLVMSLVPPIPTTYPLCMSLIITVCSSVHSQ